ncbi:MAG: hypothetical protein JWM91_1308, partial [Rhodospirillales bacterium]|nr:hypothetical protein [Rhodospirillales bacterium]
FSGFVNAGDAASVPNQFAPVTGTTAGSGVGTYPITLLSANPNSNYTTTYVGANLTITPAPLTITPNATKVYGAALPTTLPALDFAGLVAGDTPARFTTQPTLNTSGVNVGSYSITASGAVDPNYTISYAPGTLAITPASLTITANDASRNYGGVNPGFSASYSGLVNGDTASTLSGLTFATAATSASNVGVYQILPSGAVDPNYTISYAPATLTINPAPLQITPSGGSIYGQSPATTASVTYNAVGFANGDTLASLTTQPSFATPAISTTNVGFYALFASGASDPNYTISYQPGTLAVNRATVTLSVNASSTYGSPIGKVPVIAAGLVNGDTLATVFGSSPIASTTATSRSNVGTYSASIFAGPVIDTNYAVSLGSGAYRITPAPLLITANDQTYSYGTTNPAFGVSYSGLVNGDTSSVVSGLTVSSTAIIGGNIGSPPTLISNVGTYQTTAFGGSASNYAITYAPGTLRITRAPLSITPSGASVYGQDPNRTAIVSYDIAGLVNGDTLASLTTQPTFSTTATGGSGAGTYFLSASGASDPNYSITYFRGQLQINPATLTLTPASATSTTGSPIPAIAIIAEGLVNGDTLANIFASPPTVATGATSASQPGSYITTISAGPVTDKNYVAKLGKGTLAIKIVPALPNTTFVDPGSTNISPVTTSITTITAVPLLVIPPPKVDVITISPLFIAPETYGKALGSFGPAAGDVINMFLATMTDSKPPVTVGAVVAALKNPDTKISTAMMGLLLPFLYDYLGDILKISESAWTPNQVMFVKQFETYVQAQRRAAALQAESDYEAWAKAAVAEEQKKIDRVSGTAQIYEMAILSANPPVPPADFLNQVQAGFILTGNQTVTMAGLNAQVSAFGDAITGAQGISEFAELARAGIQLSGNGANTKTLVAKMPSLGKTILPNAKKGLSLLNEKVSSAKKALATAKDTGEDVSKAASRLQQAEDAAKIVVTAGDVVASVGVVLEVVGNAVQIGMAAAAYAQAADYNTAFQKAVNAANQPVTASDLKAMMSNSAGQQQIFNYLSTQLATAGQPPAPTQSYMTLSAILKITQSF